MWTLSDRCLVTRKPMTRNRSAGFESSCRSLQRRMRGCMLLSGDNVAWRYLQLAFLVAVPEQKVRMSAQMEEYDVAILV